MLITLLTGGSRGDIQPYIALGMALQKAGCRARLATFENYAGFVKQYGLEFYPIRGDVTRVTASQAGQSAMRADNPLKILLSFNQLKSYLFDVQKDFFEACTGSDAILYHPGTPVGYFAAQRLKIPAILAAPFPMTPTREYPALIFYNMPRLGKAFNLLTHKLFEKIMWSTSGAPVKQFWRKEFGRAPEGFTCPYPRQVTRSAPTIISCSDAVFPRPGDWPEHVYNTGYWLVEDEATWSPPADLLKFLQAGPPPVYVGFGSLGSPALAAQTTDLVIRALGQSGLRGVLATGWAGMAKMDNLPESIFMLESAPHTWLFPQMAAVVHHGGAGTTAAGLQAGIPSVVVPFSNDQFAWALRTYELGVGSRPVPRKGLTAEKLSAAINFALSAPIRGAAAALGQKLQNENGARAAVNIILKALGKG